MKKLRNLLLVLILPYLSVEFVHTQNSIELSGGYLQAPAKLYTNSIIQGSIGFDQKIKPWYINSYNLNYQFFNNYGDKGHSVGASYVGSFFPFSGEGNNFLSFNTGVYFNRILFFKGHNDTLSKFTYNSYPDVPEIGLLMGFSLQQEFFKCIKFKASFVCQKALIRYIDDDFLIGVKASIGYIIKGKEKANQNVIADSLKVQGIKPFNAFEFKLNYASINKSLGFAPGYYDQGFREMDKSYYTLKGFELGISYTFQRLKIEGDFGLLSYCTSIHTQSHGYGHYPHAPDWMTIGSITINEDFYAIKSIINSFRFTIGLNVLPPRSKFAISPTISFNRLKELQVKEVSNYHTYYYYFYSSGGPTSGPSEKETFYTATPSRFTTNKFQSFFSFGIDFSYRFFKGLKINLLTNLLFWNPQKIDYLVYSLDKGIDERLKFHYSIGIGYQVPLEKKK